MNPYQKIFSELEKAHVHYLIVGGVAVNLHGYSRFTGDIDILLALDSTNLINMTRIMKRLGYIERLPVELHELGNVDTVKKWMEKKGFVAYTFVSESRPQLDIDILVGESLDFSKYFRKKKCIKIWDLRLPVLSIDDLIFMKRRAGRDQDLIDLKYLLELKKL